MAVRKMTHRGSSDSTRSRNKQQLQRKGVPAGKAKGLAKIQQGRSTKARKPK